jgi:hypothetical protein
MEFTFEDKVDAVQGEMSMLLVQAVLSKFAVQIQVNLEKLISIQDKLLIGTIIHFRQKRT